MTSLHVPTQDRLAPAGRPGPGEPLLEVTGLCVDYGIGPDAVRAVTDADLVLHRGEVLGLAGESGSGKSTLAYAVTRLLRAPGVITGGSARLHLGEDGDIDLLAADEAQLRRVRWAQVAVVLQSAMHALNPVFTIGDQLGDVLRAHQPDMSRAARRDRVVTSRPPPLEPQTVSRDNPTTPWTWSPSARSWKSAPRYGTGSASRS